MEKTRKLNRESADALKVDESSYSGDNLENHEKWEHVTQSIDFNAKGMSRCLLERLSVKNAISQILTGELIFDNVTFFTMKLPWKIAQTWFFYFDIAFALNLKVSTVECWLK